MDLINPLDVQQPQSKAIVKQFSQVVIEADQMPDILLRRLMEEIKNDSVNSMFAYDRAHNRHNRGR